MVVRLHFRYVEDIWSNLQIFSALNYWKHEGRVTIFAFLYTHTHTLDIEKHIQPFNTLTWTMLPVRFLEPCIDCIMQSLSLLLFNILLPLILIAGLQTWFCDTYFVAQEVYPQNMYGPYYISSATFPLFIVSALLSTHLDFLFGDQRKVNCDCSSCVCALKIG